MLTRCTPNYVVPLSDSYTQTQFAKLSHGYKKVIDTEYGAQIPFDDMQIRNSTIRITRRDSFRITKVIPLSEVSAIDLIPHSKLFSRLSVTVSGAVIGLTTGWGLAKLIDSQHIQTYPIIPIFDIILIPIGGVMGGTVGYTSSQTNIYKGKYRIIPNGMTYRLRPAKKHKSPKRQGVLTGN